MNDEVFNLERILDRWKQEYGTLRKSVKWDSSYYSIPISERFDLLKILVSQISDRGKTRDFFIQTTKDKIIDASIPPERVVGSQSHKQFKRMTLQHLNMAITAIYDVREEVPAVKVKEAEQDKSVTEPTDPTERKIDWSKAKEFDPSTIPDSIDPPFEDTTDEEWDKILGYKK